jgi:hypothetical protein
VIFQHLMNMQKGNYKPGQLNIYLQTAIDLIKEDSSLLNDIESLKNQIKIAIPSLYDRSVCYNCNASMKVYTIRFDSLDALLLISMAKEVRKRFENYKDFTIANQVHITRMEIPHSIQCRTTQASKLGLVAQLLNKDGKRVPSVWVITRRGWKALNGEKVPARVEVFRGSIVERDDDVTTLSEALKTVITRKTKDGELVKPREIDDYRNSESSYLPDEWIGFTANIDNL